MEITDYQKVLTLTAEEKEKLKEASIILENISEFMEDDEVTDFDIALSRNYYEERLNFGDLNFIREARILQHFAEEPNILIKREE